MKRNRLIKLIHARNLLSILILQDNNIPESDTVNSKAVSIGIRSTSSASIRYSLIPISIFELPSSCHKKVSPPSHTIVLEPESRIKLSYNLQSTKF